MNEQIHTIGSCVEEFASRHNIGEKDTINQMKSAVKGAVGKWLKFMVSG